MYNVKVADDNGNGIKKIVVNGKLLVQPNVMAKSVDVPNTDSWGEKIPEDLYEKIVISLKDDDGEYDKYYLIGNYALKSGKSLTNLDISNRTEKLESEVTVITTLGFIAANTILNNCVNNEVSNEVIEVSVDMATAIPVAIYTKKEGQKLLERFMGKEFEVRVLLQQNQFQDLKIKFDYVNVIPEGVTSMHYMINADNMIFENFNKKNKDKLSKEVFQDPNLEVFHIAIGEGTTEMPLTINCIAWDENFKNGVDEGTGTALAEAGRLLEEQEISGFLERQGISEVLKNTKHKFYNEVKKATSIQLETVAEKILKKARAELKKAPNVDVIMVYGGGSIVMNEHLEDKLQKEADKKKAKLLYIDKKYAPILEVLGLNEFVNSEIFKMLKEDSNK